MNAVTAVLVVVVHLFVARLFVVPSGSMEPTLHGCPGCTNDWLVVDELSYLFGDPAPGDVVVFHGPPGWAKSPGDDVFVKRVIAEGGQTVECCDERGRVLVDGRPVDEPYLNGAGRTRQASFPKVVVPQGELWLMGDNRSNSTDSRVRGAVPADNVIGLARWVVLHRWQQVTTHGP